MCVIAYGHTYVHIYHIAQTHTQTHRHTPGATSQPCAPARYRTPTPMPCTHAAMRLYTCVWLSGFVNECVCVCQRVRVSVGGDVCSHRVLQRTALRRCSRARARTHAGAMHTLGPLTRARARGGGAYRQPPRTGASGPSARTHLRTRSQRSCSAVPVQGPRVRRRRRQQQQQQQQSTAGNSKSQQVTGVRVAWHATRTKRDDKSHLRGEPGRCAVARVCRAAAPATLGALERGSAAARGRAGDHLVERRRDRGAAEEETQGGAVDEQRGPHRGPCARKTRARVAHMNVRRRRARQRPAAGQQEDRGAAKLRRSAAAPPQHSGGVRGANTHARGGTAGRRRGVCAQRAVPAPRPPR
jgi:hypothetical protein